MNGKIFFWALFTALSLAMFVILMVQSIPPKSIRAERLEAQCRYRVSVAMLPYLDNPRAPSVAASIYDDCIKARGEL